MGETLRVGGREGLVGKGGQCKTTELSSFFVIVSSNFPFFPLLISVLQLAFFFNIPFYPIIYFFPKLYIC